jgi:predicted metal-binding protein
MPLVKSCKTCRWVGCRNYGRELNACVNYIMSLEEEKKIEKEKLELSRRRTEIN